MSSGVDVVIAAFDSANYVREAIDSVMRQTSPVQRIIVVDDGSTDGTADIARAFGPPVQVLRQPNRGAASARNAGIAQSAAALVAFLDADDRWLPQRVDEGVRHLSQNPSLGYGCSRMRTFPSPELPTDEQRGLRATNAEYVDGWLTSALLVRRATLDTVGAFAEDLRIGEVIDWLNRARAAGITGGMHPDVLVERRLHRANSTRVDAGAAHAYLTVAKRHLDRIRAARGDGKA